MKWSWSKKAPAEQTPVVRILDHHENRNQRFPAEYVLFSVEGSSGMLREVVWETPDEYDYVGHTLMLGEIPLASIHTTICPTCCSLLATGYGRPSDDPALREAADRMNCPYQGIDDALKRLAPILKLLWPGSYVLGYGQSFPTDGEKHFFWDIPADTREYWATVDAGYLLCYAMENAVSGYLYPSQSWDNWDEARVEYYREKLRSGETLPPVIAYQGDGNLAILLDGHHRAAACALEGVTVPCLTISVLSYLNYQGKGMYWWPDGKRVELTGEYPYTKDRYETWSGSCPFVPGEHWSRDFVWPEEYRFAAQRYPTAWELGYLIEYPEIELTEAGLKRNSNLTAIPFLLDYLSRQPGTDAKALAFAFAGEENDPVLRETAWRILSRIKNDPEVEGFFVDRLVHMEKGRDSKLWEIADTYWE